METVVYLAALLSVTLFTSTIHAQEWETPIIEGYGKIVNYKAATLHPNPEKEYKILFHIKTDKQREDVNEKLWKIARLINLMGASDVSKDNLHIVAVISGGATPIVLSDRTFQKRFDKSNPDLDILKKLSDYGVKFEVCGQALAKWGIDPETDMNRFSELTLSALTAIPAYEMEGYVPMF